MIVYEGEGTLRRHGHNRLSWEPSLELQLERMGYIEAEPYHRVDWTRTFTTATIAPMVAPMPPVLPMLHYARVPIGTVACGIFSSRATPHHAMVTCGNCRRTKAFKS